MGNMEKIRNGPDLFLVAYPLCLRYNQQYEDRIDDMVPPQ